MRADDLLLPRWPAPARVGSLQTTRAGGVSLSPWASLNLGGHVADDPLCVAANRARLRAMLPDEPCWLTQVHGVRVLDLDGDTGDRVADAALTRAPGRVCVIMTADCLPVLLCDTAGTVAAAAHAGWRGLNAGVLEATVAAMGVDPATLLAWFGPALCPRCFEVGEEVRQAFLASDGCCRETGGIAPFSGMRNADACFARLPPRVDGVPAKYRADLRALAMQRLFAVGVRSVSVADNVCTSCDPRFFSYRRDGVTGRIASLIWLQANA